MNDRPDGYGFNVRTSGASNALPVPGKNVRHQGGRSGLGHILDLSRTLSNASSSQSTTCPSSAAISSITRTFSG